MSRSHLHTRAQRWLALRTNRRPLLLDKNAGVVSFSFDDAPHSACKTGAAILERHACKGTWYIAGGLTDRLENGCMSHSIEDLIDLRSAGHHIGCHTYSHRPCVEMPADAMHTELVRNKTFLMHQDLVSEPLHFSFPLGYFDIRSKRIAGQTFASCRITGGGIQHGVTDLNALRSDDIQAAIQPHRRQRSLLAAYLEGLTTNALNPKVAMFYLAALPQFVPMTEPHSVINVLTLVFIHSLINLVWFGSLIFVFSNVARAVRSRKMVRWLKGLTGIIFLGFGARLATLER